MCMSTLSACMSVCNSACLVPTVGSLGTGVTEGCELSCGFLELNPDPLEEKPVSCSFNY